MSPDDNHDHAVDMVVNSSHYLEASKKSEVLWLESLVSHLVPMRCSTIGILDVAAGDIAFV